MTTLNLHELATATGLSERTIRRYRREDPSFPSGGPGGPGSPFAYDLTEVEVWLASNKPGVEVRRPMAKPPADGEERISEGDAIAYMLFTCAWDIAAGRTPTPRLQAFFELVVNLFHAFWHGDLGPDSDYAAELREEARVIYGPLFAGMEPIEEDDSAA